jgi:benzoyl-CoA reductase subunit D
MALTAGIDVGSSSVKASVLEYLNGHVNVLANSLEKIRRRRTKDVVNDVFSDCLKAAEVNIKQLDYVATTGDREEFEYRTGHFYGMTTHARAAVFFRKNVKSVVDIGAFHTRVIKIDDKGKVLAHIMTGQCASGTGQFVENITRYLGIGLEEVGPLSLKAKKPERISSICAVLSETDVINMVSRGIHTSDIVKGIHLTLSDRVLKMLSRIKADFPVFLTGGMAVDVGLLSTFKESAKERNLSGEIYTNGDAVFAGSLGAAILGGFRYEKLDASILLETV